MNVQQTSQGLTVSAKPASNHPISLTNDSRPISLSTVQPATPTVNNIENLKLEITPETETTHVQIYDADENVYQVPESVSSAPSCGWNVSASTQLVFEVVNDPFHLQCPRRMWGRSFQHHWNDLFSSLNNLRLRTQLPRILTFMDSASTLIRSIC